MSTSIKSLKNEIILQNDFTKIAVSEKNGAVVSAVRLDTNESYLSSTPSKFFTVYKANEEEVEIKNLKLDGNVIYIVTEYGEMRVEALAFDRYFTFEILDDISEPLEMIEFANIITEFDIEAENAWGAVGIAMTVNTNPISRPKIFNKRVRARAERETGNTKGAKFALVSAPAALHRDILKEASETIDPQKGLILHTCGAFAKDYLPNYQNYVILHGIKDEYVKRADEYKAMGIDQFDFHQSRVSFVQGSFKCAPLGDAKIFKEKFSDPLAEKGIMTALHTYVHYIDPVCHEYLADPKWQKDLLLGEEFTLAEDISADDTTISTVESIEAVSTDHTFFSRSLPYILIGNEIISFTKSGGKFTPCGRGVCGTKAVPHKKGEKVYHMLGLFNLFASKLKSPLFYEIAHNTAKAYNEGGFGMIYLDAMDGMTRQTQKTWYYDALFTHEVVKNCVREPIVEYADSPASVWAALGRAGAWDAPTNAFKSCNRRHVICNRRDNNSCHLLGMMGWYNLYPAANNYVAQYHHWDDAEYLGASCLINGYSMVFRSGIPDGRVPAYSRNLNIYMKYYRLIKEKYFSEEYLSKLKDVDKEYFLKDKGNGKWSFEEKKFEFKRYFDIADEKRNKEVFDNPFKKQTPFVRIEPGFSALENNKVVVVPFDENKPISESFLHNFGSPMDLSKNSALKVRIYGNGKKGGALKIVLDNVQTKPETIDSGFTAVYFVETDFTGYRDYIFVESQRGERRDLPFYPEDTSPYKLYMHGFNNASVKQVRIDTIGDVEGVRMSSIYAYPRVYDVVKNPKVKVGNTEVTFECEIKSTDFIEWDGKTAKILDRFGNESPIYFSGNLVVPKGKFKAELTTAGSLNGLTQNAKLTLGFTGKEIK